MSESIRDYLWLGITDRRQEGTWLAIDDWTEISYANWASVEPNNWRNEDYAVMRPNGQWNDYSGSEKTICAVPSKFMFFYFI